jgi:predicted DNA-binding protein (MmcQ/YjbR family)
MSNLERTEAIVADLPEAERVDIEKWGGHPSFRVRGKNFVFCNLEGTSLSLKLSPDEAQGVVATDPTTKPTGYGLGRHGWIDFALSPDVDEARWEIVAEWILTSYCLVAPETLARQVLAADARP